MRYCINVNNTEFTELAPKLEFISQKLADIIKVPIQPCWETTNIYHHDKYFLISLISRPICKNGQSYGSIIGYNNKVYQYNPSDDSFTLRFDSKQSPIHIGETLKYRQAYNIANDPYELTNNIIQTLHMLDLTYIKEYAIVGSKQVNKLTIIIASKHLEDYVNSISPNLTFITTVSDNQYIIGTKLHYID